MIQRATELSPPRQTQTLSLPWLQRARLSLPGFCWARLLPLRVWKAGLPASRARRTGHHADYSRASKSDRMSAGTLQTCWGSITPFLLSNFLILGWECLLYIVWLSLHRLFKEQNFPGFLGSQERNFFPQDESYLKFQAYLIWILWWDLGLKSWC